MMAAYGELCTLFHDAGMIAAPTDELAWYAARLPRGSGPNLAAMCGSSRSSQQASIGAEASTP